MPKLCFDERSLVLFVESDNWEIVGKTTPKLCPYEKSLFLFVESDNCQLASIQNHFCLSRTCSDISHLFAKKNNVFAILSIPAT